MRQFALKVVTFNVQDYYPFRGHGRRMRETGRLLADLDPDMVGLQEALIGRDRGRLVRQLRLCDSRLRHTAYFRSGLMGSGLQILSAYPIVSTAFRRFSRPGKWYKPWHGDYYAGKGVALARLEHPGFPEPVAFYNTHLQAKYPADAYRATRASQLAELAAFIRSTSGASAPAIVAGDLNCSSTSEPLQRFIREAGLVRLMTSDTRVDHILGAGRQFDLVARKTVRVPGVVCEDGSWLRLSDHVLFISQICVTERR